MVEIACFEGSEVGLAMTAFATHALRDFLGEILSIEAAVVGILMTITAERVLREERIYGREAAAFGIRFGEWAMAGRTLCLFMRFHQWEAGPYTVIELPLGGREGGRPMTGDASIIELQARGDGIKGAIMGVGMTSGASRLGVAVEEVGIRTLWRFGWCSVAIRAGCFQVRAVEWEGGFRMARFIKEAR